MENFGFCFARSEPQEKSQLRVGWLLLEWGAPKNTFRGVGLPQKCGLEGILEGGFEPPKKLWESKAPTS